MVSVGPDGDVVLQVALLGARYLLHLPDLRHAELRVVVEEGPAALDGQVVLGPIPQFSEVLVVQRVESIRTEKTKKMKMKTGSEGEKVGGREENLLSLEVLPPNGSQFSQKGERHQGVGSAHHQVAGDLLDLPQTGLQLGRYVICKRRSGFGQTDLEQEAERD